MTDILLYQGYQRREMLGFLHRLCIQRHRDALLDPACTPCGDGDCAGELGARVTDWCGLIIAELNQVILEIKRRDPGYPVDDRFESRAQILFSDQPGMTAVITKVIDQICADLMAGDDKRCDAVLWQVLGQHFKTVMDQYDGLGDAGTHRQKTRRRIDRLRKDLEARRGAAFVSPPEAAAAIITEIGARRLSNMPSKQATVEDYLYELAADDYMVGVDEIDLDPTVQDTVIDPELLVSMQACIDQLPPELREAIAIKQQWDGEPVFLRREHIAAHYGFGWETVRKRARMALEQLRECLEI